MKKLFFTLCALCLCGTMWAQDAVQDEDTGLWYTVEDDEATIVAVPEGNDAYTLSNLVYVEDGGYYTLPATLGGYPVVDVADYAFQNDFQDTTNPIHLVIPANVNRLGQRSFQSCTQIEEVTLEYSTSELKEGSNADTYNSFYQCSGIKTVNVYRNVTYTRGNDTYHTGMFSYQTSIVTINIGAEVTSFVHYMFSSPSGESSLTTVNCYIDTPITLATGMFENINSAAILYVHPYSVDAYKASDWANIFSDIQAMEEEEEEQPEGTLMDIATGLFFEIDESTGVVSIIADQESGAYYDANLVPYSYDEEGNPIAYTLPYYVENKDGENGYVTRVAASAFEDSAISGHLVIPATITDMGQRAFAGCTGVSEVTYEYSSTALHEENRTNIGDGSFLNCSGVKTVNLYRDINYDSDRTDYQSGPFVSQTSIETINIGPRVRYIPSYMFRNSTYATSGGGPIKTINCYAVEPPTLGVAPFARLGENTLNVPQGTAEEYSSASVWSDQINGSATSNDYGICTLNEMSNAFAITTHDNGEGSAYATFYNSASDVELFDDGTGTELTAYVAYQLDDEGDAGLYIEIAEIGNTIPAATGVIVETEEAGTYLAIATGESTSYTGSNDLYGYDTAQPIDNPSVDEYYFYLLSSSNGQVGFYWGADEGAAFTCQAHKAYLALSQDDVKEASQISIRKGNGGEDTTGISSVESATEGATVKGIYTIQGVRVNNMNQSGLYIVDGKKVLVK